MSVCEIIYITYNFLPSSFLILLLAMMAIITGQQAVVVDVDVAVDVKVDGSTNR